MTPLQRQKRDACKRTSEEVNPIKSRLLTEVNRLRGENAAGAAADLDKIVARLEAWQAKHAR